MRQRGRSRAARLRPTLQPGPELTIQGDRDQLEQLLINLLRNAVDASLETGGGVTGRLGPAELQLVV